MIVPGTNAGRRLQQEEAKRDQERLIAKKVESFRSGRDPQFFPEVKLEVSDKDFVELLSELDHIYIAVHKMNAVLVKYSNIIHNMSNLNVVLGQQAENMYPADHENTDIGAEVSKSQAYCNKYYRDFQQNHAETLAQFRGFYYKFEQLSLKLKLRDKAMEKFKHYYYKLKKLNEDKIIKSKIGDIDPDRDVQQVDYLASNEKKYQQAYLEFQQLNTSMHGDITDLLRNKYKALTPIVTQFMVNTQNFFAKAGPKFAELTSNLSEDQQEEEEQVEEEQAQVEAKNLRTSDPQDLTEEELEKEKIRLRDEKRERRKKKLQQMQDDEDYAKALNKEVNKIKRQTTQEEQQLQQQQQQEGSALNRYEREYQEMMQAKEQKHISQKSNSQNQQQNYSSQQQHKSSQNLYYPQQQQYQQQQQQQVQQQQQQQQYLQMPQQTHQRRKSDTYDQQQQYVQQQQYFNSNNYPQQPVQNQQSYGFTISQQQQQQQPRQQQQQQYYQQPPQYSNYQYQDNYYEDDYYDEPVNQNQKVASGIGTFLGDIGINKEEVAKGIIGALFGGSKSKSNNRNDNYYDEEDDYYEEDDRRQYRR